MEHRPVGVPVSSISVMFYEFCNGLVIGSVLRTSIADRVGRMVRCLNEEFRSTSSTSTNRFYVGSYGRNTAIPTVSDVDVLYELPASAYQQYDNHAGDGQSALLQRMRTAIMRTYPNSVVIGDGQVVVVNFTDGIRVEVLGAFQNVNNAYTFPDSNNGGTWRECKPKQEMLAFSVRDTAANGNLTRLGRMVRAWRDYHGVPMSGMLIDTLAYQFIDSWGSKDKSYLYYDWLTRDFFLFLSEQSDSQTYWLAPGSSTYVHQGGSFKRQAKAAYQFALDAIDNALREEWWATKNKFRSIYGTGFPS